MPAGSGVSSLPFGPCTATVLPSSFTVTPLGTAIGFFPIRDIGLLAACGSQRRARALVSTFQLRRRWCLATRSPPSATAPLPDLAEQFSAQAFLAGLAPGHHALGRGENVDPQAAQHARDLGAAHVHPAARARYPLHVRDRRLVVGPVLQVHAYHLVALFFGGLVVGDVAFLFQDAGNLQLQLGGRDIHFLMPGLDRVADARPHVCDRIGHPHRLLLLGHSFAPRPAENLQRPAPETSPVGRRPGSSANSNLAASSARHAVVADGCGLATDASPTRTTSKPRESLPSAPARGNTSGRSRTCAGRRAGGRRSCSCCVGAKRTWASLRP